MSYNTPISFPLFRLTIQHILEIEMKPTTMPSIHQMIYDSLSHVITFFLSPHLSQLSYYRLTSKQIYVCDTLVSY